MDVRSIGDLAPDERRAVFRRASGVDAVRDDVREIVDRVREARDVAPFVGGQIPDAAYVHVSPLGSGHKLFVISGG